jgi:hypothetical protein
METLINCSNIVRETVDASQWYGGSQLVGGDWGSLTLNPCRERPVADAPDARPRLAYFSVVYGAKSSLESGQMSGIYSTRVKTDTLGDEFNDWNIPNIGINTLMTKLLPRLPREHLMTISVPKFACFSLISRSI